MQALLMMLKPHRSDLHTKLNVKRSNFFSFFQALILTCGQNAEIIQCRDFLGKFIRSPGTSFTETVTTFDSVYCHWQQHLGFVENDVVTVNTLTLFSVGYFLQTESVGGGIYAPQCIFGNFFRAPP